MWLAGKWCRLAQFCLIEFPAAGPDPECCEPGGFTDRACLRVDPVWFQLDAG